MGLAAWEELKACVVSEVADFSALEKAEPFQNQACQGQLLNVCGGLQEDISLPRARRAPVQVPTSWEACREEVLAVLRCSCLRVGATLWLTLKPPGQPYAGGKCQHSLKAMMEQVLAECAAAGREAGYRLGSVGSYTPQSDDVSVPSTVLQLR